MRHLFNKPFSWPLPGGKRAFSLVEVSLALAVVSASFIPLLGLMCVGLGTLKDSNVEVQTNLIARKYLAEAKMVPFDELSSWASQSPLYLDIEGQPVSPAQAAFIIHLMCEPVSSTVPSTNIQQTRVRITGPATSSFPREFGGVVANLGD